MLRIKDTKLKPLIESFDGLHLSAYIENDTGLLGLKHRIREAIDTAEDYLKPVLDLEARKKFLKPLEHLAKDSTMLKSFRSNIAIFRTKDSFRVINVPTPLENLCVVATSFHVKPLLKWLQSDQDFLFLGVEDGMVSLYQCSMGGLRHMDSVLFPIRTTIMGEDDGTYASLKRKRSYAQELRETWDWVNSWLSELPTHHRPRLFVVGEKEFSFGLLQRLNYRQKNKKPLEMKFTWKEAANVAIKIRQLMKEETKEALKMALMEFYWADDEKLARKNIYQIAQAAVQGRIRKLIVADGINIFGKVCKLTGGLNIHPAGIDHEDDDILDDIAQKVLMSGGEVIVAPQSELPNRLPALAILERHTPNLSLGKLLNAAV